MGVVAAGVVEAAGWAAGQLGRVEESTPDDTPDATVPDATVQGSQGQDSSDAGAPPPQEGGAP